MANFLYFYAKFTEEFLLLSGALGCTLSSYYCYAWVVKKRRLGAARDQVPAGMVKIYLNQLINEAQVVRTQLFGLSHAHSPSSHSAEPGTSSENQSSAPHALKSGEAPSADLLERVQALQNQLSEKESMVININIEKTKLHEEIENLKQNQKALDAGANSGASHDLLKKIKTLEERLEEYSLFEDDLANLKRLQQENLQLKKQVEEHAKVAPAVVPSMTPATTPAPERANLQIAVENEPMVAPKPVTVIDQTEDAEKRAAKKEQPALLDQAAIDALLNGSTPVSPETMNSSAVPDAMIAEATSDESVLEAMVAAATNSPANETLETATPAITATPAASAISSAEPQSHEGESDAFERLVDSVEGSLATATTSAPPPAAPTLAVATPPTEDKSTAEKTDEELLKEFENLLNS